MPASSPITWRWSWPPSWSGAAANPSWVPQRMLVDTGSGEDVIAKTGLPRSILDKAVPLDKPSHLYTANGPTVVDTKIEFVHPMLGTKLHAVLMDNSPPVIAVGRQVKDESFDVHWVHGFDPYFALPDGRIAWLGDVNNVPWDVNKPGGSERLGIAAPF